MTNTTALDLDRLEALAKEATEGPWEYLGKEYGDEGGHYFAVGEHTGGGVFGEYGPSEQDSKFIAAANPAAILELIQLARRSNAGEAAGIKTWQERLPLPGYANWSTAQAVQAMEAEIADLRAALATQQPVRAQQVPVGCGGTLRSIVTTSPQLNESQWDELVAAPVAQQSEAGAQDAARYRFLREHWVSFSAAPPLSNLHWKGDKLDAKVDAAILEGGAHG